VAISELYSGTEAVGATEWSCTTDTSGPDSDTTDVVVQLVLDLSDMVAGDELEIKFYEKCRSGDTQRLCAQWNLTGAQAFPNWISPSFIVMHGWDFTLKTIAGTSITVNWSVRSAA
jgi:hypothetical protein